MLKRPAAHTPSGWDRPARTSCVCGTSARSTYTYTYTYTYAYAGTGTGTGASVVNWQPALPGDDRYQVLVAYSAGTNRATNATYTVHHAGGSTPVVVNQQVAGAAEPRGGTWRSLGVYSFLGGIGGRVVLTDAANQTVIADAVRFRRQN